MKVVRTPEERFRNLRDFPFEPNNVDIPSGDGTALQVHYLDEGQRDAEPVLMLHGEPSWSYLYRNLIPVVRAAGLRAIAPDFVGFGRSDKPVNREDYTYRRHIGWMLAFVEALDLRNITLLCQNWGGLIGLRLVAEHPQRFAGVIASNTTLPTGDGRIPDMMRSWLQRSQAPEFSAGEIVQSGCVAPLPQEIVAAYDAPFPGEPYKAGAREFPMLVPVTPDHPESEANRRAWRSLARFDKPFLTVFGERDPFTAGAERVFQRKIPGASGQPHQVLKNVGHFIQEDASEDLAQIVISFVNQGR